MDIRVLGPIQVDGGAVGPRLRRALLARLIVARGAAVPAATLIEDLWNGRSPRQADASLHAHVSHLRLALEPRRGAYARGRVLVRTGSGYAVRLAADSVDAWRFERLVSSTAPALHLLAEAERLWRGPAFGEFCAAPWAASEVAHLVELRRVGVELRCALLIRLGHAAAAVPELEALLSAAPARREGWRLLSLAVRGSSRTAAAAPSGGAVRDVVRYQLGRLPAEVRHVVRCASVVGDVSRLLEVSGGDSGALAGALASGLLRWDGGSRVRFHDPLTRDAVLEGMSQTRRAWLAGSW